MNRGFRQTAFGAILAILAGAAAAGPSPKTVIEFDGREIKPTYGSSAGQWLFAEGRDVQLLLLGNPLRRAVASLERGRRISIAIPHTGSGEPAVRIHQLGETPATVTIGQGRGLRLEIAAPNGAASVLLDRFPAECEWRPDEPRYPQSDAVACSPAFRPAIEEALIDWDWRMQDGIDAPREPQSYDQATAATLARGQRLLSDLIGHGVALDAEQKELAALQSRCEALKTAAPKSDVWESLWTDAHRWRRRLALANPLANVGPVVFAKSVPSSMSHQLTQYYGYTARPGGGLFVLAEPGHSMAVRNLAAELPPGCVMQPEPSFDAQRVYFAFCPCEPAPRTWGDPACMERRFHLFAADVKTGSLQQLTDGPHDDFSPKCLPNGKLLMISTRRGGFHRCGRGPCYVYTLAVAEADGSNPQPISFHETNEWDPAVLNDGRLIYTRWDYVDRNAIFYQQLWSAWQDGSHVQIVYGNNTYNPVGTWEARPIPGSNQIMATGAAHHGMTAGSIIRLDPARAVDGPDALTRLTPDALFPEAESGLAVGIPPEKPTRFDDPLVKTWGPQPQSQPARLKTTPTEERRWPGHCYRSPYPLSEKYFLAAYSFDRLRGEPGVNRPNMFGLYLCDAFGNKELLYRDPNISSLWPVPLRPREKPPKLEAAPMVAEKADRSEGTFFLQNVYESWPKLPDVSVKHLRIVQVLPKTTPHANSPRVGAANASPGKQVLGTVPVESDGSAYFLAPARTPLLFQALDERGRAVQTMRSLTYLQPGEQASCAGCHEHRQTAPAAHRTALAIAREPSAIAPGPDGSRPLSYPILVQPVLDRHCVSCHNAKKPESKLDLTGEIASPFVRSYNALMPFVSFSAWGNPANNYEPLTQPGQFGARASKLTAILDRGHYDVKLTPDDWERLNLWLDANALFYGTFQPQDQAKQLRGEHIAGAGLE